MFLRNHWAADHVTTFGHSRHDVGAILQYKHQPCRDIWSDFFSIKTLDVVTSNLKRRDIKVCLPRRSRHRDVRAPCCDVSGNSSLFFFQKPPLIKKPQIKPRPPPPPPPPNAYMNEIGVKTFTIIYILTKNK